MGNNNSKIPNGFYQNGTCMISVDSGSNPQQFIKHYISSITSKLGNHICEQPSDDNYLSSIIIGPLGSGKTDILKSFVCTKKNGELNIIYIDAKTFDNTLGLFAYIINNVYPGKVTDDKSKLHDLIIKMGYHDQLIIIMDHMEQLYKQCTDQALGIVNDINQICMKKFNRIAFIGISSSYLLWPLVKGGYRMLKEDIYADRFHISNPDRHNMQMCPYFKLLSHPMGIPDIKNINLMYIPVIPMRLRGDLPRPSYTSLLLYNYCLLDHVCKEIYGKLYLKNFCRRYNKRNKDIDWNDIDIIIIERILKPITQDDIMKIFTELSYDQYQIDLILGLLQYDLAIITIIPNKTKSGYYDVYPTSAVTFKELMKLPYICNIIFSESDRISNWYKSFSLAIKN
jgi:hypothetical protein